MKTILNQVKHIFLKRRRTTANISAYRNAAPIVAAKMRGYVSWPDEHEKVQRERPEDGIRVGRTKDGGFIAFPA